MKKLLFLMLIIFTSCGGKEVKKEGESAVQVPEIVYVTDSTKIMELEDKIIMLETSLQFYRDSVPYETYINARRIEKIKYYIRITENKPSNQKFFYGWIRRTMDEK
jgi:hypothetical protein